MNLGIPRQDAAGLLWTAACLIGVILSETRTSAKQAILVATVCITTALVLFFLRSRWSKGSNPTRLQLDRGNVIPPFVFFIVIWVYTVLEESSELISIATWGLLMTGGLLVIELGPSCIRLRRSGLK